MNRALLKDYIDEYKTKFKHIHDKEIYKWRAVKQFQDNWDLDADDFSSMLEASLSETHNLLAAAQYLPRKMILTYSQKYPKQVRDLFLELYDEDSNLLDRITAFQNGVKSINARMHPEKSTYQDVRAILVYLAMKYPDTYFLYKYKMFKKFCEKIDYEYRVKLHAPLENVFQYLNLCSMIREELLADNELLKLHTDRINETEYLDTGNILTQDFIYAVTGYLNLSKSAAPVQDTQLILNEIDLSIIRKEYKFKGNYVDHAAHHKRNKYIGDIGEQIVLAHEKKHCPPHLVKKIIHSSKSEGDGLGYDILSFEANGAKKFIEVKATKGRVSRPFFISGTELERSKQEGERYFLYRLYNLNDKTMTAEYYVIQGDLSKYCINPTEYEVILKA